MKPLIWTLGMIVVMIMSVSVYAQGLVFLEQDGLLMMEVESAPMAKGWVAETELKGFTGENYYRNHAGGGELHYRFVIVNPGRYHFRIHNRHDHPDKTEENDCWVSLNGGPKVKLFSWQRAKWNYISVHEFSHSNKVPSEYDLEPGEHVITLSGRSPNFMIDHILLYKDKGKKQNSKIEKSKPAESVLDGGVDYRKLKHLTAAAGSLKSRRIGSAYVTAEKALTSDHAAEVAEARQVIAAIEKYVMDYQKAMTILKTTAPYLATEQLKVFAGRMRGSKFAKDLNDTVKVWSKEEATRADKKAEALMKKVQVCYDQIMLQTGGEGPRDQHDLKRLGKFIDLMKKLQAQLHEDHPNSRAKKRCDAMIAKLGLNEAQ